MKNWNKIMKHCKLGFLSVQQKFCGINKTNLGGLTKILLSELNFGWDNKQFLVIGYQPNVLFSPPVLQQWAVVTKIFYASVVGFFLIGFTTSAIQRYKLYFYQNTLVF